MKNTPYIFMIIVIIAAAIHALYTLVFKDEAAVSAQKLEAAAPFIYVAKVGKTGDGKTYINSIQALDRMYAAGFRHFLLNLNTTKDGRWVCMNDWKRTGVKIFQKYDGTAPLSFEQFQTTPTTYSERPCNFKQWLVWQTAHADAFVIFNIHGNYKAAAKHLQNNASGLQDNIALMISNESEKDIALSHGFKHLHWSIASGADWKNNTSVLERGAVLNPEYANLPAQSVVERAGLVKDLNANNIAVVANPINDCTAFKSVVALGVRGVYTDSITPNMCR